MIGRVIDVSSEDGFIDWAKVKAWGCNGAILRCTNALDFIDPDYVNNVNGCVAQSIRFGSMMVIHAWEPILDQFAAYCSIVDGRSVVSAVDWELRKGETAYHASLALIVGLLILKDREHIKPWLYLNLDYLLHRLRYANRVLSICDVWYSNPTPTGMKVYPGGLPKPIAHQYTWKEKVPGVLGACDVNIVFRDEL